MYLDSAVDSPVNNVSENGREDLGEVPVHQYSTPQSRARKFCQEQTLPCVVAHTNAHRGRKTNNWFALLCYKQKLLTLLSSAWLT